MEPTLIAPNFWINIHIHIQFELTSAWRLPIYVHNFGSSNENFKVLLSFLELKEIVSRVYKDGKQVFAKISMYKNCCSTPSKDFKEQCIKLKTSIS